MHLNVSNSFIRRVDISELLLNNHKKLGETLQELLNTYEISKKSMKQAIKTSFASMLETLPFSSSVSEKITAIHAVYDSDRISLAILPRVEKDDPDGNEEKPIFLTLNHFLDSDFDKPISNEAFEALTRMMIMDEHNRAEIDEQGRVDPNREIGRDEHGQEPENDFMEIIPYTPEQLTEEFTPEEKDEFDIKKAAIRNENTITNIKLLHKDDIVLMSSNKNPIPLELPTMGRNRRVEQASTILFSDDIQKYKGDKVNIYYNNVNLK